MTLRERFLSAVRQGYLGKTTEYGTIVTVAEFKAYFTDINEGYAETFLPSAVIEDGQYSMSHTRFVFRVKNGVYRVHPQALEPDANEHGINDRFETAFHWCYAPKI